MKSNTMALLAPAALCVGLTACAASGPSVKRSASDAAPSARERVETSRRLALAGDLSEAEAILWPGLRAARGEAGAADRARLLVQLGRVRTHMLWRWDLSPDLAADPLDEALALAERTADPDLQSDAHDTFGMLVYSVKLFRGEGDWQAIEDRFRRALAAARDDARRATIRFHLGLVRQMQGDLDRAGVEFTASLALARAAGADQIAGEDLRHLAVLAAAKGDLARAIELHGESLRLRRKIGNPPGEATAHLAIGKLHLEASNPTAARPHLESAYRLSRQFGLGYAQVAAAAALAPLEARAGRAVRAKELIDRALLIARSRRSDENLTHALLAAAEVAATLGRGADARAHLDEARKTAARTGAPELARACDEIARRLHLDAAAAAETR